MNKIVPNVQRWEKGGGLPVQRLVVVWLWGKLGQVYAHRSELDRWVSQRQPKADPHGAIDPANYKDRAGDFGR